MLCIIQYNWKKSRDKKRVWINTKQSGRWKKKSPESLTAWSTQVADSQETDLIMLLVTMLCPYSGWHRCWQRPPLHSNQETKCCGAPQSPVGESLANHLQGFRESNRKYSSDIQYNAIRQTGFAFHPGDSGPPRGQGRREADQLIDRATAALPCMAIPPGLSLTRRLTGCSWVLPNEGGDISGALRLSH